MDTIERQSLADRTRQRNSLTWLTLDFGGVMAPLAGVEADLDIIARASIENFMAISDEAWGIKEFQRDRTIELSHAEIDQDVVLAEAKFATGRARLAIEKATDEYTLAVRVYDATVRSLLMGVKEYAAQVELEQLANEKARTGLAIDREELRRTRVKNEIFIETIQQEQVKADIARSQVDVAKAHVRAALAGIEAGKAEIDLIEAEVQKYMAEAEKATLQADVATIYAEILTKKLSEIKLDVGRKEIAAAFTYIQSKLDDTLALYDIRGLVEGIRTEGEVAIKTELDLLLEVEKAEQDLRNLEADYARLVFEHEKTKTELNIEEEIALKAGIVDARNRVANARYNQSVNRDATQTAAQILINNAHKRVYAYSTRISESMQTEYEYISGE